MKGSKFKRYYLCYIVQLPNRKTDFSIPADACINNDKEHRTFKLRNLLFQKQALLLSYG